MVGSGRVKEQLRLLLWDSMCSSVKWARQHLPPGLVAGKRHSGVVAPQTCRSRPLGGISGTGIATLHDRAFPLAST